MATTEDIEALATELAADIAATTSAPAVTPTTPAPGGRVWNHDFPVPLKTFTAQLTGTHDEVWIKLMHAQHGHKKQTEREFAALLDQFRSTPAS